MSSNLPPMGSPQWLDLVFSTPPVRGLKGHSKHTQYHQAYLSHTQQLVGCQGRNELNGLLMIEYLMTLGHITRVKPQPFTTRLAEFGCRITPDFLMLGKQESQIYAIEVKSQRFLTRLKHRQLELNRERFHKFGITYLAWTDASPLIGDFLYHGLHARLLIQISCRSSPK